MPNEDTRTEFAGGVHAELPGRRVLALTIADVLPVIAQTALSHDGHDTPEQTSSLSVALTFPAPRAGASFVAANLPQGKVRLSVYSSLSGRWALLMRALPFGSGGPELAQLEYRVAGGVWRPARPTQLMSLQGGAGWHPVEVEFRLAVSEPRAHSPHKTLVMWQVQAPQ